MSVMHNEGKLHLLDIITQGHTFIINLMSTSAPLPSDATLLDIDQVTYGGYTSYTYEYGVAALNADGDAQAVAPPQTWSGPSVGTVSVYGWYVQDGSADVLLFWQQFDTPVVIGAGQTPLTVIPKLVYGLCVS